MTCPGITGLSSGNTCGMIRRFWTMIPEAAGFRILRGGEAFRPILFYDAGAFVWFARVIEWEFPGFSVDRCFDRLLAMQEELDKAGRIQGTIHRYLILAQK